MKRKSKFREAKSIPKRARERCDWDMYVSRHSKGRRFSECMGELSAGFKGLSEDERTRMRDDARGEDVFNAEVAGVGSGLHQGGLVETPALAMDVVPFGEDHELQISQMPLAEALDHAQTVRQVDNVRRRAARAQDKARASIMIVSILH